MFSTGQPVRPGPGQGRTTLQSRNGVAQHSTKYIGIAPVKSKSNIITNLIDHHIGLLRYCIVLNLLVCITMSTVIRIRTGVLICQARLTSQPHGRSRLLRRGELV